MAKKQTQETGATPEITTPPTVAPSLDARPLAPPAADPLAGTRPPAPALPQGIEFRFMSTGDPRKDFHPRHRHVAKIDPACLVVAGEDPFLALPIDGNPEVVRIRQVGAVAAAELLTCDPATGGRSIHRLATDEEAAKARAELEARKRK